MIFIKMQLIVIASFLILASETTVRLLKKRIHNGVKFSRMIKYTNQSIIGMKNNENSKMAQELSLDVLMVADFSTYQAFLEISNNDDYSAQHYLNNYLTAIFEQTKLIYDKIKFGSETLKLRFAGTFIARREEDCPLWLSWEEENEEAEDQLDQIESNSTWIHDQTSRNLTFSDEESDALDPSSNSSEFRVPRKKLRRFVDSTLEDLEDNNSTEMSLKIDSKRAIDKFTVWIKQYSDFLPRHEHAVLITKFDLISINGHSATQGMAYVGNVCQLGESSSVVEDIGASLTALIAAHEIGHSLGALHDGAFEAVECDSNDNFLLAAAISGSSNRQTFLNSRAMSNCSIRSIIENFKRPSASCVKKWGQNSRGSEKGSERSDKFSRLPGETISSTQQCQVAFGPTFGTCRNRGYYHHRSICERVWCSDRRDRHNDVCQTLNYFPAFDGTECGYNLWCIEGECVKNPKKWMDCTDLNSKTCSKYSASKLKHFCKSKDFRDICCRTCAKKGKIV